MLRTLLAGVFLAHGIAHVVGFVVPWRIVTSAEVPYRTTVLGTDVGPIAVRALGIAWLIVACLFVALAASVFRHAAWWNVRTLLLVGLSVVLCVLGLPEARPGLLANAAILALLALGWALSIYPDMHV